MAADDSITLRYAARRGEVWSWYWQSWRAGFWRTWLGAGFVLAALLLAWRGREHPIGPGDLWFMGFGLLSLAVFMAAFPQIMFKHRERVLAVGPDGIDTTIGKKSAHRDWSEISAVEDRAGVVAITVRQTGNAFLIPNRAFADDGARADFLRRAAAWHAAVHT